MSNPEKRPLLSTKYLVFLAILALSLGYVFFIK